MLGAEYKELKGSDRKGWEEWRTYEVDPADYDEDKRETGLRMLKEPSLDESNRLEESMSPKPQLYGGREDHRFCHMPPPFTPTQRAALGWCLKLEMTIAGITIAPPRN